jgi:excisionase family DNA binding protein
MTGPKRYLSTEEFSALTGYSLATIYRRLKDGSLRATQLKPRTRWLIPYDALEAGACRPDSPAPEAPAAGRPQQTRLPGPRPRWQARTDMGP